MVSRPTYTETNQSQTVRSFRDSSDKTPHYPPSTDRGKSHATHFWETPRVT